MDELENKDTGKMTHNWGRILLRFLIYAVLMIVAWRLTSGTWASWQAWLYISVDVGLGLLAAAWVPLTAELEEERTTIKAGIKKWDKYIVLPLSLWFPFGLIITAGLDYRFGGSGNFALSLTIAATFLAISGRVFSTWAAASNTFYSRFVRIQSDRGHQVVESGPYAIIRHPGYCGLLIFLLGAGVILGSWWTLLGNMLVSGILIVRTALEDHTLRVELDGYAAYAERVRYRLIPGLW
jgi:protein-S-isoprenylcysteine O-methyltransferase Ste14